MAIRIFIDQGHNPSGYPNTGASYFGQEEQDITFEVGLYLRDLLVENGNFEVMLSRPTAETVLGTSNSTSLIKRVDMANQWPADYFISIHANASLNPATNGTEVYVYSLNTPVAVLAKEILTGIVEEVGTKKNGVRENPTLYVLRRTAMPSLLVEMAYMSNPGDAQKLRNDRYGFALGIYNGIVNYFL